MDVDNVPLKVSRKLLFHEAEYYMTSKLKTEAFLILHTIEVIECI